MNYIPDDVLYNHIIIRYPKDWIFVSKGCYDTIKNVVVFDPRININKIVPIIDSKTGSSIYTTCLFEWACYFGHYQLVQSILSKFKKVLEKSFVSSIRFAIFNRHESIALLILTKYNFKHAISEIFECAARSGCIEIIKKLKDERTRYAGNEM